MTIKFPNSICSKITTIGHWIFCYNGFEMHESKNRDRFNYSYTSIEE